METEKIYLTMKRTGAGNIVLGTLSICVGIVTGVMLIVTGANLLKKKKHLNFQFACTKKHFRYKPKKQKMFLLLVTLVC